MPRRRKNDPFYKAYDPEFHPKDIIEIMSQGLFNVHIWTKWDIDESTFYRWLKEHPELEDAYRKGEAACQAYWISNKLIPMANGEIDGKHSFNATKFLMEKKFKEFRPEKELSANININNMNVLDNKTSDELIRTIQNNLSFLQQKNVIQVEATEVKVLEDDNSRKSDK